MVDSLVSMQQLVCDLPALTRVSRGISESISNVVLTRGIDEIGLLVTRQADLYAIRSVFAVVALKPAAGTPRFDGLGAEPVRLFITAPSRLLIWRQLVNYCN